MVNNGHVAGPSFDNNVWEGFIFKKCFNCTRELEMHRTNIN